MSPPDPLLRPVWEEAPVAWLGREALVALLVPLCDAQEALARLDARTAAAPAAVREGLCARLDYPRA